MDNNRQDTALLAAKIDQLQAERDRHALQVEEDRNAIASERFALQQERAELAQKQETADLAFQQDKSDLAAERAELAGERAELAAERAELAAERSRLEQVALAAQRPMTELASLRPLEARLPGRVDLNHTDSSSDLGTMAEPVPSSGGCNMGSEANEQVTRSMEQVEREREALCARGKELKTLAKKINALLTAKEKGLAGQLAAVQAELAITAAYLVSTEIQLKTTQAQLDAVYKAVPPLDDRFRNVGRARALEPGELMQADGVDTRDLAGLRQAREVIAACNKNFLHHGMGDELRIETKCPQVGRQSIWKMSHYYKLLDWLYPNGKSKNPRSSRHTNPHHPTRSCEHDTLFAYYLHPLYTSGEIPKLTPDLKLFFSAPCIADGAWIQFHGPGTTLYDLDPNFVVYMGSLCGPNNEEKFTVAETHTQGGHTWVEEFTISQYSVSIRWQL